MNDGRIFILRVSLASSMLTGFHGDHIFYSRGLYLEILNYVFCNLIKKERGKRERETNTV